MIIGFTGTKNGMTPQQRASFLNMLDVIDEFHHGDCIGADEEASILAAGINIEKIVTHPPENPKARAYFPLRKYHFDTCLEPKPYLVRNHAIVDACELLLAAPSGRTMVLRSGTWATVRYAIKVGKPYTILYPDGTVRHEYKEP